MHANRTLESHPGNVRRAKGSDLPSPPIVVTGATEFIGMHVVERLVARGEAVVGIDALTSLFAIPL